MTTSPRKTIVTSSAPLTPRPPRPTVLQNDRKPAALVVTRTLRSGQHVHHDGSIVVLGDVHAGAEIVATGDILVMGALRGVAHAGARGNEEAIVAAFRLDPLQVRIGSRISRPPEGSPAPSVPEVARVRDGRVVIDPYLPSSHHQQEFGEA